MARDVLHQLLTLPGGGKVDAALQHAAAVAVGGHLAAVLACCLVDELREGTCVLCGVGEMHMDREYLDYYIIWIESISAAAVLVGMTCVRVEDACMRRACISVSSGTTLSNVCKYELGLQHVRGTDAYGSKHVGGHQRPGVTTLSGCTRRREIGRCPQLQGWLEPYILYIIYTVY